MDRLPSAAKTWGEKNIHSHVNIILAKKKDKDYKRLHTSLQGITFRSQLRVKHDGMNLNGIQ